MKATRLKADAAALATLRAELAAAVAHGTFEVPLLPRTATQVLDASNDPACDARRLGDLIQGDPSLAGHVLSVSNSAAYSPREPIVSLPQAISRLGLRVVGDIALAVALKSKVFALADRDPRLRSLWFHALCSGTWAKEIARARRKNVEGAFLCGLLHDVGEPTLLHAGYELFARHGFQPDPVELDAWALELHAEVGALVLERWRFPAWMTAAVRWHHAPERSGEHREHALTAQLSDLLAHASTTPDRATDAALARHPALSDLDLYADEFQALLGRRESVLAQVEALE